MAAPPPTPSVVVNAVETYVRLAYGDSPPLLVKSQLDKLHAASGNQDTFYRLPLFTHDLHQPPTQYALRLGNRLYPHMKMSVKLSPNDQAWLFRVETHDAHVCPPAGSREHEAFVKLMDHNQKLADAIESAWVKDGLATFKTYLRDDLARRQQSQSGPGLLN